MKTHMIYYIFLYRHTLAYATRTRGLVIYILLLYTKTADKLFSVDYSSLFSEQNSAILWENKKKRSGIIAAAAAHYDHNILFIIGCIETINLTHTHARARSFQGMYNTLKRIRLVIFFLNYYYVHIIIYYYYY